MNTPTHICDCGAHYSSSALVEACQIANHYQLDQLREAAPALLAQAEKCLKSMIAERDCYYEGCASRGSGYVHDPGDRETLDLYDKDIDELRAVIARAKGGAR